MSKRQKVRKFFKVSEINKSFQMAVDQMEAQFRAIDKDDDIELGLGNEIADRMNKSFQLIKQQILDYTEKVYEEFLSEDDLDALITFYSSPVAIRIRELAPELTQRINQKITELMKEAGKILDSELDGEMESKKANRAS